MDVFMLFRAAGEAGAFSEIGRVVDEGGRGGSWVGGGRIESRVGGGGRR